MGLDLYLLTRVPRGEGGHVGWSYGGFNRFRRRLAEAAGLGEIDRFVGYGGAEPWPPTDVQPLVPLLHHSDCEGELWGWEVEGLANALRATIRLWPEDDYDRKAGELFADMIERAEQGGGVVAFR
ncbi:MAG TPA: hypothetical protein VK595_07665 [Vicinamibacterales bacterium]|nr:hypothetical protein [Vicinamibacterales bacterium]